MKTLRTAAVFAAGLAMLCGWAANAEAQVGYVYPSQGYSTVAPYTLSQPATINQGFYGAAPCANGRCGVGGYSTSYGAVPCSTGNCPTGNGSMGNCSTGNCVGGNCPTGNCPNGNCPTGRCQTICGPNGCRTICPTGPSLQPGVNTAPRANGSRPLTSLNLDQAPAIGATGFVQPAYDRPSFDRSNFDRSFAPSQRGYFPANVDNSISGDPSVRLY